MKRRITLLMAAMMLATIPGSAVMASEVADVVIVEDEAESVLAESGETEAESSEEEIGKVLIEAVEEVPEDEAATVQEGEDEPAVVAANIPSSGYCGDNIKWTFEENGTLTIEGTGDMPGPDEVEEPFPWMIYCSQIKSVIIEEGITSISEGGAFDNCNNLQSVSIPDSVTVIGNFAFSRCTNLASVTLPEHINTIGNYVFFGCTSLTEIVIPDSVKEIGAYAFYGCSKLSNVTIGNSVSTIGMAAFLYCESLKSIVIPQSVNFIDTIAIGYMPYMDIEDSYPIEFTIYGYTGTVAETYAATSDKFTFVALDGGTATVTLGTGKISSLTNVAKGIKIKWSKVSGADGYYIYRMTGSGSYKKIKTITSASTVSYTDKKVVNKNGNTYTYKVVPYSGSTEGTGSETTTVRLTGTTLTSVKNSAASKAKVKWTAVTSVTGYQIQYSTSSSFASGKTKTVSGTSKSSKTLTGLTKGSTYYVRIRTYKTVNGTKYYSAWSSKLKVAVTK